MSLTNRFVSTQNPETLISVLEASNKLLEEIAKNTKKRPEQTLEFKMTTSSKRFPIDPPLSLHDGDYCMGLISLSVYNTIYNVTEKNNNFRYYNGDKWFDLNITPGAYELEQINDFIQRFTGELITITANVSTQKCEIKLAEGYMIDFTLANTIGTVLGFNYKQINNIPDRPTRRNLLDEFDRSSQDVRNITRVHNPDGSYFAPLMIIHRDPNTEKDIEDYEPMKYISSDKVVDISSVEKIHLNCDKIQGSILNGTPSSILYSFDVDVSPGYKIIKDPSTVLYKNVTSDKIESLEFYLVDDDGNPVDFNGETLTFTLQLIKK